MQITRLISILVLALSIITISITTSSLLIVISIILSAISGGMWIYAMMELSQIDEP